MRKKIWIEILLLEVLIIYVYTAFLSCFTEVQLWCSLSAYNPALKYFTSASLPQRQSEERSGRLYLKNIRSILGIVKTTWRWGTSRRSCSCIHSPHSSHLFEWHDEQNPRVRQENISNFSVLQSEHFSNEY